MDEYQTNNGEADQSSVITKCLKTKQFLDQIDMMPLENSNLVSSFPKAGKVPSVGDYYLFYKCHSLNLLCM